MSVRNWYCRLSLYFFPFVALILGGCALPLQQASLPTFPTEPKLPAGDAKSQSPYASQVISNASGSYAEPEQTAKIGQASSINQSEGAAVDSTAKNILPGEGMALPPQGSSPNTIVNPWVWGLVGMRGYPLGDQIAPNGVEYTPLFQTEMHFNLWLWRRARLYAFTDLIFWAQRAAPGITNPSQGPLDFSKRQFDLTAGVAWNYTGRWEARAMAYSYNNLNRGQSAVEPAGYNDGVGIENRYYLNSVYDALGTADFDLARAAFVSVGYYPSKDMVDAQGNTFKPGFFARAYLILDVVDEICYLYLDAELINRNTTIPKLLDLDFGVAFRPFPELRRWEFRIGSAEMIDLQFNEIEYSAYGAIRFVF